MGDTLDIKFETGADVVVIEGVRFSGDFFREFGKSLPTGIPFIIAKRDNDGLVTIRRLSSNWHVVVDDPE